MFFPQRRIQIIEECLIFPYQAREFAILHFGVQKHEEQSRFQIEMDTGRIAQIVKEFREIRHSLFIAEGKSFLQVVITKMK